MRTTVHGNDKTDTQIEWFLMAGRVESAWQNGSNIRLVFYSGHIHDMVCGTREKAAEIMGVLHDNAKAS